MNQTHIRMIIIVLAGLFLLGAAEQKKSSPQEGSAPGGKAGKLLHILPYDDLFEMISYMKGIKRALGVSCVYCHNLNDFAVDDPKANRSAHKNAARAMIRMVDYLNTYIEKDPFLRAVVDATPFQNRDLKKPGELVTQLRDAKDPLSQYLRDHFSEDTRKLLDEYDGSGLLSERFQKCLIDDLNQVLRSGPLYDEKRFANVKLTDEARNLITQKIQGEDLVRLNQLLLQEAYPKKIVKSGAVDCFLCHRGSARPSQLPRSALPAKP